MKKKAIYLFLIILSFVFVALLLLPVFFENFVEEKLTRQLIENKNDFYPNYNEVSLSFLRDFPNASLKIKDLDLITQSQKDTILSVDELYIEASVLSLLQAEIDIISINLFSPSIKIKDQSIFRFPNDSLQHPRKGSESAKVKKEKIPGFLRFNNLSISKGSVCYHDTLQNILFKLSKLDLNYNSAAEAGKIYFSLKGDSVFFQKDEIQYIRKLKLNVTSKLSFDLEQNSLSSEETKLILNNTPLVITGSVSKKNEAAMWDVKVSSPNSQVNDFLSLMPDNLITADSLNSEGDLYMGGEINGVYIPNKQVPSFRFDMKLSGASLHFANKPKEINELSFNLNIKNDGSVMDSTKINLEHFNFKMDNSHFKASLFLWNPLNEINFSSSIVSHIDLLDLQQAFPVNTSILCGKLETDIKINGSFQAVKNDDYKNIKSEGFFDLKDVKLQTNTLNNRLQINNANLSFSPKTIQLKTLNGVIGRSDFIMNGDFNNYLKYLMFEDVLQINLKQYSKQIDLGDFEKKQMPSDGNVVESTSNSKDTLRWELPSNIHVKSMLDIDKFTYKTLTLSNVKCEAELKDKSILMNSLSATGLGGNIFLEGKYSTANNPSLSFDFSGKEIDLTTTKNSLAGIDSSFYVLNNINGKISNHLEISMDLKKGFQPVKESISGKGYVQSSALKISNTKVQKKLAQTLNNPKYLSATINNLDANFTVKDSTVKILPFNAMVAEKNIGVEGQHGFNKTINYLVSMPITKAEMGPLGALIKNNEANSEVFMVDVAITGTTNDPIVKPDFVKATQQISKQINEDAGEVVKKILEDPKVQEKVNELRDKLKSWF